MRLRLFLHIMPWEIDSALTLCNKLRFASYYLSEGDDVIFDLILNLSDGIIDWDKSKLDKDFFIEKFNQLEIINKWPSYMVKYNPKI